MNEQDKIQTPPDVIHVLPGDVVVFRYDNDRITNAETHAMWVFVKDKFPDNLVILLPQTMVVESIGKDRVAEFLENIKKELGLTDE